MHRHSAGFLLLALLLLADPAQAQGSPTDSGLIVEVGWGNIYRAGRWNPIYITAASSSPREVIAQIEGITGVPQAMHIGNRFALSPSPSTHVAYFPLGELDELADTVLTLRDGQTLKRIATTRLSLTPPVQQAAMERHLIGVSGDRGTFGMLQGQLSSDVVAAFLPPPYLPVTPAGYDALDVLALNAPDLAQIADDQQRAIVAWIRAGGTLLIWPGAYDTPERGPLIDALPAIIGENQLIELSAADVEAAGLARVGRVRARELHPVPGAESIPLIGQEVIGYRHPLGFGQIVIAPIDVSTLRFTSNVAASRLWDALLFGVPLPTRQDQPEAQVTRWLREAAAEAAPLVPLWVIVILLVLGPLDSLVLVLLGSRPWTVVTVLGWVGLLGAGAYNIVQMGSEQPLVCRTVRLIDEADGAAAIVTDYVTLRPARAERLTLPAERGGWWRPAIDPTDLPDSPLRVFHAEQNDAGTWPAPFPAHVPTPHVLQVQRWSAAPAIVDAALAATESRVTGRLTNRSDRPLRNLRIRTSGGVAQLQIEEVSPGETIQVDATLSNDDASLAMPEAERFFGARRAAAAPVTPPDYAALEGSTFVRSHRLNALLSRGDRACVYAEVVEPVSPIDLPPLTRATHVRFVRSLVRLQ